MSSLQTTLIATATMLNTNFWKTQLGRVAIKSTLRQAENAEMGLFDPAVRAADGVEYISSSLSRRILCF